MDFHSILKTLACVALIAGAHPAHGQIDVASCPADANCIASCARFDKSDARSIACENVCRRDASKDSSNQSACADTQGRAQDEGSTPDVRAYSKKGETLRERELNGKMVEAIGHRNLREIRRLIEMKKGLNPTFVYDFQYNPDTRLYEGRAVKLRLSDIFNDTITARGNEAGLDKVLALFIELGMNVSATLPSARTNAEPAMLSTDEMRTAWGPSPTFMERAKDRDARMRAFELALENGLKPNADVSEWLFAELPQVCGRDRSQFAIQVVDLLIKHLDVSLQDDFWRMGERGPETLSDVLDRMMSPGKNPRSNSERAQFAMMDAEWENCAPLSRRINRYLIEGQ